MGLKRRFKKRSYKPKRRIKTKRSLLKNRFFRGSILGFVLICLVFYLLFFSEVFKIKEIKIVVPSGISMEELKEFVKKEMQEAFFKLGHKDSFFFVDGSKIENKLLERYSEIKSARLKKKFPQTLILEIGKREARGVWCYFETGRCFLMDEDRIIYKEVKIEDLKEDVLLIFSEEKQKIKKLGEEVFSEKEMDAILEIHQKLRESLGINIRHFTLKSRESLNLKTNEGWEIYFDLGDDIKLTLTKLKLLLGKELPLEERKNLQYVDLRFTKVYYKYK